MLPVFRAAAGVFIGSAFPLETCTCWVAGLGLLYLTNGGLVDPRAAGCGWYDGLRS